MERRLLRLARSLREEGAAVSPAEVLDAARAALLVGVTHREDLAEALSAVLVKETSFRESFRRHFDRLFPPGIPRPPRGKGRQRGEAPSEGEGTGAGRGERPGAGREAAARREAKTGETRRDGEKGRGDAEREGNERREGRDGRLQETPRRGGEAEAGRARRVLTKGFRENWTHEEERLAAEALDELARRIATRLGRRRKAGRRGPLDVRGTLRANLRHGGVPFVLARRVRRRGRRDLVFLADVSGSVRRAAGLFLLLLGRLRDRFSGVRTFVYVDRPVELTRRAGARSLPSLADDLPGELNLLAYSDHGETFRRFNRDFPRTVRGRTVLVILGDARSNRFPPQEWELEYLRRRAGRVWWVVPEEERRWNTGDSDVAAYAPYCDGVLAAPSPIGLAAAAARIARRR